MAGRRSRCFAWDLSIEGAREEVRYADQFGNDTRLVSAEGEPHAIGVVASGEVETKDKAGVIGPHRGFAPLWLFAGETSLTQPGEGYPRAGGSAWRTVPRSTGFIC